MHPKNRYQNKSENNKFPILSAIWKPIKYGSFDKLVWKLVMKVIDQRSKQWMNMLFLPRKVYVLYQWFKKL